jgi:tetratricopeptide (TPR) repeat protein
MSGSRFQAWALGAAAVLGLVLAGAPRPALAVDLIIGGRAEQCSKDAKAGLATPLSIENCTMAITGEALFGHSLSATYVNRGTMFIGTQNYGSAMRDLDEAVALEPTLGAAYVNRGAALIGLRRYQEGLDEINKGLALNPEEPEKAYGNRGIAKWSLDDVKGAYDDFMRALELKPGWQWAIDQLSSFRVEQRAAR